jgi:hypothetical protein
LGGGALEAHGRPDLTGVARSLELGGGALEETHGARRGESKQEETGRENDGRESGAGKLGGREELRGSQEELQGKTRGG